ncbi:OmpA family protein [Rhodanobacter sp. DHB23]|uniref:OmpA family protein n=1 Tax=Rhodanobacter sp. DHB23 TaxID=2775923 RepID=UPI0017864342|nr:OmpA family protein [Rhodanobacter sp. DHB23]MBD8871684.1 OmpA family protein [Rhodanobacter sp. DHB23]
MLALVTLVALAGCAVNEGRHAARGGEGTNALVRPPIAAALMQPPAMHPPAIHPPATEQRYSLSADALFPFDKSSIDDIAPQGRTQLDELAQQIEANGRRPGMVHVIGYSDRLGSADHNDDLSRHRAYAVMGYLMWRGVPSSAIVAEGRGAVVSMATDCDDAGNRTALIACLAPDRRVEVIVVRR